MKVTMKEYYQDAKHFLAPDGVYDVDATLGEWLVAHRKAVKVETPAPDYRHLNVEPQFEQAEEPPRPVEDKPKKRGRK